MEAALTKKDSIIQSYRDHCTYVARGGTVSIIPRSFLNRAWQYRHKHNHSQAPHADELHYNREGCFGDSCAVDCIFRIYHVTCLWLPWWFLKGWTLAFYSSQAKLCHRVRDFHNKFSYPIIAGLFNALLLLLRCWQSLWNWSHHRMNWKSIQGITENIFYSLWTPSQGWQIHIAGPRGVCWAVGQEDRGS